MHKKILIHSIRTSLFFVVMLLLFSARISASSEDGLRNDYGSCVSISEQVQEDRQFMVSPGRTILLSEGGEHHQNNCTTATTQNNPDPAVKKEWIKGIDIYEKNTGFPSWQDIADAGYSFVFHKASQYRSDKAFNSSPDYRWSSMKSTGLIRGAYHLFKHDGGTVQEQAQRYADIVQRLLPGDLGTVADVEDRDPAHKAKYWIPTIHAFLDALETASGRNPIIYTGPGYWKEFMGDSGEFSNYPLWVVSTESEDEPKLPVG